MIRRRRLLATLGTGTALSLAGCSALLGEDIDEESSPAGVSADALEGTGFDHEGTEELTFEDTIQVGDEERDVSLTNWLAEYGKLPTGEEQNAANFYVFTTPTVTVAGESANPFDRVSEKRFVELVLDRTGRGEPDDLEEVDDHEVEVFGETVEITEYETVQDVAGYDVTVRLYFGSLTNDGDLLAVLGAHPKALDEQENILQLAGGVEHPVDP